MHEFAVLVGIESDAVDRHFAGAVMHRSIAPEHPQILVVFGAVGMKQAQASGQGKGLAIAGLVCGIVGAVFGLIGMICGFVTCTALNNAYNGVNSLVNYLNY